MILFAVSSMLAISFGGVKARKGGDICVAVFDKKSEYEKTEDPDYCPALYFAECRPAIVKKIEIQLNYMF